MLNFVFILAIILELFLTFFLVSKLIQAQKVVQIQGEKLVFYGKIITEINRGLNKNIKKINKVVGIFTNPNFNRIVSIVKFAVVIFQTVLIVRTLNFSKGFLFNVKNLKKLLFAQLTKEFVKKIL